MFFFNLILSTDPVIFYFKDIHHLFRQKPTNKKHLQNPCKCLIFFAIPIGFEPMTYCLEGSCSIHLSYGTFRWSG